MGCVNIKSKEFKYLAERYNVSIGQLELITHKYWMETGTEDYFPSDVYIQYQLGKSQYIEQSDTVRKLWDKNFSTSKEYDTLSQVQEAQQEAAKYFPESAIVYYKNAKNKFTLTVKEPVKSISIKIEDYLNKESITGQEQFDFDLIKKDLAENLKKSNNFTASNQLLSSEINKEKDERFIEIDKAIKSGNWTNEALNKLDNLIQEYNNGRNEITQILGRRLSKKSKSSEAYAAASIITRRVRSSMPKSNGTLSAIQEFTAKTNYK